MFNIEDKIYQYSLWSFRVPRKVFLLAELSVVITRICILGRVKQVLNELSHYSLRNNGEKFVSSGVMSPKLM